MTEQPLWHRLYFDPAYRDIARIIGYSGGPLAEISERAKPLLEKYSRERIQEVTEAIATIDTSRTPSTIQLNPEARKLCWQLLGPPPEQLENFHRGAQAPPPLSTTQASPVLKKRT